MKDESCGSGAIDFGDWRKQFVLAENSEFIPRDWQIRAIAKWNLGTHPQLPVVQIMSSSKDVVGWLLGWPIDVTTEEILPNGGEYELTSSEEQVFQLGGRWLAIFAITEKVYTDGTASISTVYMPSNKIVASSTGLLPRNSPNAEHSRLVDALQIPSRNNWYPFGLTAHADALRLLPNHCLNLRTFRCERIWPSTDFSDVVDPALAISTLISVGRAQINAIAKRYSLKGNLTAGRDTRMVLALARNHQRDLALVTRTSNSFNDSRDSGTAARIAADFGLDLTLVRDKPASRAQLDAWQRKTGACVAGAVWRSVETWKHTDPDRANIPGMVGGLGRAFYKSKSSLRDITGVELCSILKMPKQSKLVEAAEIWLEGARSLAGLSKRHLLDLLYIEQRVGCWGSPAMYGNEDNAPAIWIVSHRRIIDCIFRLPESYKVSKRLQHDVIARTWPELLQYPFNQPATIADSWLYFLMLPRALRFQARKLFGVFRR